MANNYYSTSTGSKALTTDMGDIASKINLILNKIYEADSNYIQWTNSSGSLVQRVVAPTQNSLISANNIDDYILALEAILDSGHIVGFDYNGINQVAVGELITANLFNTVSKHATDFGSNDYFVSCPSFCSSYNDTCPTYSCTPCNCFDNVNGSTPSGGVCSSYDGTDICGAFSCDVFEDSYGNILTDYYCESYEWKGGTGCCAGVT